jgi:hypothetical protein
MTSSEFPHQSSSLFLLCIMLLGLFSESAGRLDNAKPVLSHVSLLPTVTESGPSSPIDGDCCTKLKPAEGSFLM